ncbi:MAG: hypothetical protein IJU60_00115 [Acholeplasmatales bacterium]|nr:hypothetical protein [Acholeplasmatales bacterium]
MENKCTTALCFIYNPIYKDRILSFFKGICENAKESGNLIECGKNKEYNVDINNMIRKTIFDFLGHEEEVKEFLKANKVEAFLEIVPEIKVSANESKPILSLDDDIIKFLYTSGIRMDLDYYLH